MEHELTWEDVKNAMAYLEKQGWEREQVSDQMYWMNPPKDISGVPYKPGVPLTDEQWRSLQKGHESLADSVGDGRLGA